MKLATGAQMHALDQKTIQETGIAGIVLMENASRAVGERAATDGLEQRCVVVAGGGNNGGDGFAIARLLRQKGMDVTVVFTGTEEKLPPDARCNYEICHRLGLPVITEMTEGLTAIAGAQLLIDALLGTGFHGVPRQKEAEIIRAMNQSGAVIVAVDLPSGVESSRGRVEGEAVRATETVTFQLPKAGLLLYPGTEYVGKLTVADISIPAQNIQALQISGNVWSMQEVGQNLPKRRPRSHKGTYGRVVVCGGSANMTGAVVFSVLGAYRSGCGLVYGAAPSACTPILHQLAPEAVLWPLEGEADRLTLDGAKGLLPKLAEKQVLVIGPGLGQGEETAQAVELLLTQAPGFIVLDADGINALAGHPELLRQTKSVPILTPHPKEMSRLTGKSVAELLDDPITAARDFAMAYGVVLLLKDARTIIAMPDGQFYVNPTGTSALSKGGSGDVLTGMIAGLLAQNRNPGLAASLGAYLHGLAGQEAAKTLGNYGVLARDLIEAIAPAFQTVLTQA